MTCRHQDGDPNCTTKNPDAMRKRAEASYRQWVPDSSPDCERFDIIDIEEIAGATSSRNGRPVATHPYLVVKAVFPSCESCSYEGTKIMVFAESTIKQAVRWRRLDPHFRIPVEQDPTTAPPPIARFPATATGWEDAMTYARSKAAAAYKESQSQRP